MGVSFGMNFVSKLRESIRKIWKREQELSIHQAPAEGSEKRVKDLLKTKPDICLFPDQYGRIPLHVAVCNDKVEIVKELLWAKSESLSALTDTNSQLKAKDKDGNTALHLAVLYMNIEIIRLLIRCPGLDVNALNKNGATALDVLLLSPGNTEIKGILQRAGAMKANDLSPRKVKRAKLILGVALAIVALTFTVASTFGAERYLSLVAMTFEAAHKFHNANRTFYTRADHEANITWAFCTKGPYFKVIVTVTFLSSLSIAGIIMITETEMRALKEMMMIAISSMIVLFSCYTAWHPFEQVAVSILFGCVLLFVVSSFVLPFGKWLFKKCGIIGRRNTEEAGVGAA